MVKSQIKNSFNTKETAMLSGMSITMLDYLCRSGVILPSKCSRPGRGSPRLYTFGDIVMLKALHQLLKHGISIKKLKNSLKSLRKHYKNIEPGEAIKKYLVADDKRVYLKEKKEILVDLTSGGQLSFAFILELDHISHEVIKKAVYLYSNGRTKAA